MGTPPSDSARGNRFPFWPVMSICFVAVCGLAGCHGTGVIMPSPLTVSEQQRAVVGVVPLGLSRDEVAARLAQAGIEYSPGSNDTIWYCDIWNRENGERWHLNVALLFDERGELYLTRPAQGELVSPSTATADESPRHDAAPPQRDPRDLRTPFVSP